MATAVVPRAAIQPRVRRVVLPNGWPLYALFVGFPLWWLLGMEAFVWPIFAFPLLLSLIARDDIEVPKGFGVWVLFLLWTLASITQLDEPTQPYVFLFRLSLYLASTVIFVYVYNQPPSERRKSLLAVTFFGAFLVCTGFLSLILPHVELTTLTERLMPGGLLANTWVHDLVHVRFAQTQILVSPHVVTRPAAPFPYTNEWGSTFAIIVPLWVAGITVIRRPEWRRVAIGLLLLSIIPLIASGNRGAWLSISLALVFAAVRKAWRGRVAALASLVLLIAAAGLALFLTPLGQAVKERGTHQQSNETRLTLYQQAIEGVSHSPLFGYGAPRPSQVNPNQPPVGTHGQLWLVMFSHGIPAAVFFVGFLLLAFLRTRWASSSVGFWANVALFIALAQLSYYEVLVPQIGVLMVAVALAWRETNDGRILRPASRSGAG